MTVGTRLSGTDTPPGAGPAIPELDARREALRPVGPYLPGDPQAARGLVDVGPGLSDPASIRGR
jgi:hypothetical protein